MTSGGLQSREFDKRVSPPPWGSPESDVIATGFQVNNRASVMLSPATTSYNLHQMNPAVVELVEVRFTDAAENISDDGIAQLNIIPNVKPVAAISTSATTGNVPATFTFSGSSSSDADGNITSWCWNFGNRSEATGPTVSHTYSVVETYTAGLQVADNSNETESGQHLRARQSCPAPHDPGIPLL